MTKRETNRAKRWKRRCSRAAMAALAAGVAVLSPSVLDDGAGLAVAADLLLYGGGGGGGGGASYNGGGGGGGGAYLEYGDVKYFAGGGSGDSGNYFAGGDGGIGGGGGGGGSGSGDGGSGGSGGTFGGGASSGAGGSGPTGSYLPPPGSLDGFSVDLTSGSNATSPQGANGGAASFTGTGTLYLDGKLSVISGGGGESGDSEIGGNGGAATFDVGTIVASGTSTQIFTFTKGADSPGGGSGGDLSVNIATLTLENDVNLTTHNYARSEVVIDTINFIGPKTLDTSGSGDYTVQALRVQGGGAKYNRTNQNSTLDATDMTLSFVMDSTTKTSLTMLDMTSNAIDNVDGATINLSGVPIGLDENDTVTLIKNAISSTAINKIGQQVGRRTFDITQTDTTADVIATLKGIESFSQYQPKSLGNPSLMNSNLASGANYLDYLDNLPDFDPGLMYKIELAFNDAEAIGGRQASFALKQLYGSYSAYANQALSDDMARFRLRWQGQNRSFLDSRLFDRDPCADPCAPAAPACGRSRLWAGGFGTWSDQDDKGGLSGYKYDSQGAVLGYEYSAGNLNLGVAAAYSRGDLKVSNLSYKNKPDVFNLALYGAYVHDSGLYLEGGLGYGHAWNDYKVNYHAVPGAVKKGKYGSDIFTADFELGYIARLPGDFNVIPSVGVEYSYLKNGSWKERVNDASVVANRFRSGHDSGLDIPVGLRFNKMIRFGCDGGYVVPELRASYVYSADKSRPSVRSGLAGAPGYATVRGVDPGRNLWRFGAGLSGRINSRVDFRLDYDFETRSGYKAHNLTATVGLSF